MRLLLALFILTGCIPAIYHKEKPYNGLKLVWQLPATPFETHTIKFLSDPVFPNLYPTTIVRKPPYATDEDGSIYLPQWNKLLCANTVQRKLKWRAKIPLGYDLQIKLDGPYVIVYTTTSHLPPIGKLVVLDKKTGRIILHRQTIANGLLAAGGGRVFIFNAKMLCAYDTSNFQKMWEFHVSPTPLAFPEALQAAMPYSILLNAHFHKQLIFAETASHELGYQLTHRLDFFNGQKIWDALGKVIKITDKEVHLLKEWQDEVTVRDTENGKLLRYYKIEGFTGDFVGVYEGDVIFTCLQKKFMPPLTWLKKEGAEIIKTAQYFAYQVVRVGKEQKYMWNITLAQPPEKFHFQISKDYLLIYNKEKTEVSGYNLKNGKHTWKIEDKNGIAHAFCLGDFVMYISNRGKLSVFRIIPL
jgi:hypothetical protein